MYLMGHTSFPRLSNHSVVGYCPAQLAARFRYRKTDDGSLVYETDVHHGIIRSLALTHDDKRLTICMLNMENGSSAATFEGDTDEVKGNRTPRTPAIQFGFRAQFI
jgi:hypothetical protein